MRSRFHPTGRPPARRGAILLVVLAMLALFAVLGLSFVLYAESAATAARINREALSDETGGVPYSRDIAAQFLGQLLYPIPDTATNNGAPGDPILSAVRGYEMARMVWGFNSADPAGNCVAYNGLGTFHETITLPDGSTTIARADVLNWAWQFDRSGGGNSAILDPEHSSATPRTSATTAIPTASPFIGKNAGYTYPDRNNAYVAVQDPNTGRVIVPSFHRPALFNAFQSDQTKRLAPPLSVSSTYNNGISTNPTTNDDWLNKAGRFKTLRPRPADHILPSETATDSKFPYPPQNPDGTTTGDVQNIRWANGVQQNDSVWLFPNLGVFPYRGKLVTPLIAPIILPLDGRVNLSAHGNLKNTSSGSPSHASNMGFGAWEVDLSKVVDAGTGASTGANNVVTKRYGGTATPNPVGVTMPDTLTGFPKLFHPDSTGTTAVLPPYYSRVDWDGTDLSGAANKWLLPGRNPASPSTLTLAPGRQFGTNPIWPGIATKLITTTTPTPPGEDYKGPYDNGSFTQGNAVSSTSASGESHQHPALFNPLERGFLTQGSTGPGVYPFPDLRQLAARYSDKPGNYDRTYVGYGTGPLTGATNGVGSASGSEPNNLTTNSANVRRALITPVGNSLKRAATGPNAFGYPSTDTNYASFELPSGSATPVWRKADGTTPMTPTLTLPLPTSGMTGASNINTASTPIDVRAISAALGALDLNRQLTDYRTTTTQPLKPDTVTAAQFNLAWADRQRLAQDIFARLVVITGAAARVNATTGVVTHLTINTTTPPYDISTTPTTSQQTDALRWLAQLAANIVDYIDNDDVSTPFVWNPKDPADALSTDTTKNNFTDLATINARVVFGVEKPRLVLNEAYAEATNDPADKGSAYPPFPSKKHRLRFFLELLNTGSAEPDATAPLAGSDGNFPGSVFLRYKSGEFGNATATSIPVYRIQVFPASVPVRLNLLQTNNNPTGSVTTITPSLKTEFVAAENDNTTAGLELLEARVEPNDGQFKAATGARNGFAVVCPKLDPTNDDDMKALMPAKLDAAATTSGDKFVIQVPGSATQTAGTTADGLDLQTSILPQNESDIKTKVIDVLNNNKPAVVLRRLACPYMPANDPADGTYSPSLPVNPYITVDFMTEIAVNDAIKFSLGGPHTASTQDNYSVGRIQPHAGFQDPNADIDPAAASATWKDTFVLGQPTLEATTQRKHSFFRHNSKDATGSTQPDVNLPLPFEWLTHLDRRLVSPAELLHVSAVRPHEVTARFAAPPDPSIASSATRPTFHLHAASLAMGVQQASPIPAAAASPPSPLYRMLDLLTVKPWTYNSPEGGRVAGRVNVNMLWDQDATTNRSKVFDAVMNRQSANLFADTDLTAIWNGLKGSRSPGWADPANAGTPTKWVGNSFHETNAATDDRPIRGFGTPMLGATAGTAFPFGSGLGDTLLRTRAAATGETRPQTLFSIVVPDVSSGGTQEFNVANPTHPFRALEPLQKAFNNLTTVSDTYLVVYTIGFFEVRNAGPYSLTNTPVLGAEVFRDVPGDLRSQYTAVIDRTQFGVDQSGQQVNTVWTAELSQPADPAGASPNKVMFFASGVPLDSSNNPIPNQVNVFSDGQQITLKAGSVLRLGTGDAAQSAGDGEWVTIKNPDATDPNPITYDQTKGVATITLTANLTRFRQAGSPVSNALLRNPGPQSGFDPGNSRYKGVVPFFSPLTP